MKSKVITTLLFLSLISLTACSKSFSEEYQKQKEQIKTEVDKLLEQAESEANAMISELDDAAESETTETEAPIEEATETDTPVEETPAETEKEEATAPESETIESYMLDLDSVGIGQQLDISGLELEHGSLLSVINGGDGVVVVKAKIKSSYNNKSTINQNYMNVRGLICDHGFDSCNELQYWAVADMQNGEEAKCISFTLGKEVIDHVYDGNIVDIMMGDYVSDLWILPSLQN